MARREYRDAKGRLKGYSENTSDRYKWMPKWMAFLVAVYLLYEMFIAR